MNDLETQDKILLATLPNVVFDGWTEAALIAGVEEAGFEPSMAVRAFPYGVDQVLAHFAGYINRQMSAELENIDLSKLGLVDRLVEAMAIRLRLEAPYKEAVRKAMSHYAMPSHAPEGVKLIWQAVDEMWWSVGDQSVDFNYYTKRASLAAVYGATMAYWFEDSSEDHQETLGFYRVRLLNVVSAMKWRQKTMGKFFGSVKNILNKVPSAQHFRP